MGGPDLVEVDFLKARDLAGKLAQRCQRLVRYACQEERNPLIAGGIACTHGPSRGGVFFGHGPRAGIPFGYRPVEDGIAIGVSFSAEASRTKNINFG